MLLLRLVQEGWQTLLVRNRKLHYQQYVRARREHSMVCIPGEVVLLVES